MAKILFVQNFMVEYLGIMYLSSAVKKQGHNCAVAIGKDYKKDIYPKLIEEKPNVVGISLMTFSQDWSLEIARNIKKDFPSIKIIFGGPHPTYFHDFINEPEVDIMVVGEAEQAFTELVSALEKNKPINKIKNVHCKIDGKIYRNPIRPVLKNLDELEFPDRNLYKLYSWKIGRKDNQNMIASRGCPFKCTYCYNNAADDYYGSEIRFTRTRSPGNVILELEQIKKEINPKKITFHDDFFGLAGKKWIYEFLEDYSNKIKIPFLVLMRADMIARNPEIPLLLKKAGCFQVCFGIESGNEYIRNEIIKKNLKNEDIIKASELIHEQGIYLRTCNLLGIPGEKIENIYETIELNQKIKADFPHPYIFYPFPKTQLTEVAIQQGLLDRDYDKRDAGKTSVKSFHHGSILNFENKNEIENLHKLFQLAVAYPSLMPKIKEWAKKDHKFINKMIFKLILGYKFKKVYKLSLPIAIYNFMFR